MKDLVSKVTFGFFMAQFVPGVIVVYSFSFLYVTFTGDTPKGVTQAAGEALNMWAASAQDITIFAALSTGAGMAVHGLHWAVLGFLETYFGQRQPDGTVSLKPVAESFWHDKLLIVQILCGPIKVVAEIAMLFFCARRIDSVAIEENVSSIHPSKMEAFKFLQDFYLHFSQFYAHTSYALVLLFAVVLSATWLSPTLKFSRGLVLMLVCIWLVSGFFFVISRIQLAALFKAENAMRAAKGKVTIGRRTRLTGRVRRSPN